MDLSSRDRILQAASQLFASQGFDATGVREIAERAGVNVSAINYHFGSKAGLFEALLVEFTQSKTMMSMSMLDEARDRDEMRLRLRMFADYILKISLEDPEPVSMIHKNMDRFVELSPEAFKKSFLPLFLKVVEFFEQGQRAQFIRADIAPEIVSEVFFGSLMNSIKNWPIGKKLDLPTIEDMEYREKLISGLIEITLRGIEVSHDDS